MTCGGNCSKIFLFVVNFFVWAIGVTFLTIGCWIAVSPSTFVQQALTIVNVVSNATQSVALANYLLSNTSLLFIGAYIMISVGLLLFIVGFCGCCGACKESKLMLLIYMAFCILAFAITLSAGIIEANYMNLVGNLTTQAFISLQVTNFDGMYNSANALSQIWFTIMQAKQCCGVNGPGDFQKNSQSMATHWYSMNSTTCASRGQCFTKAQVPVSCCTMSSSYTVADACPRNGSNAFSIGCQTAFIAPFAAEMQKYAAVAMGITFGLSIFCLLAVFAAGVVIHAHGLHKEDSADISDRRSN